MLDTDVLTGHDLGATLADDYLADTYFLTIGALHSEILRIGIA